MRTEIISERKFTVNNTGYFMCKNILVKNGIISKDVNVHGYICKDNITELFIDYNDSLAHSKLKANVSQSTYFNFGGIIWYCSNDNNICNYSQLGTITGVISNRFEGTFVTPLMYGSFDIYLMNEGQETNTD